MISSWRWLLQSLRTISNFSRKKSPKLRANVTTSKWTEIWLNNSIITLSSKYSNYMPRFSTNRPRLKTCNLFTILKSKSSSRNLNFWSMSRKSPTSILKTMVNQPNKNKMVTFKIAWKTWRKTNRNSKNNMSKTKKSILKKLKSFKKTIEKSNSIWSNKMTAILSSLKENMMENCKKWNRNSN